MDGDLIAALERAGAATIANMPWMTVDRPLPEPPLPAGVTLHWAGDDVRVHEQALAIRADAYESMSLPAEMTTSLFGAHRPARTTIQAAALPGEGLRVEIDCIAYVP